MSLPCLCCGKRMLGKPYAEYRTDYCCERCADTGPQFNGIIQRAEIGDYAALSISDRRERIVRVHRRSEDALDSLWEPKEEAYVAADWTLLHWCRDHGIEVLSCGYAYVTQTRRPLERSMLKAVVQTLPKVIV